MSRLKNLPWSLVLLFITFSVFGWRLIESIPELTEWVLEKGGAFGISVTELMLSWILLPAAAAFIIIMAVSLTAPILWMRVGIKGWLKSDINAFASTLLWAFAFVLIFSYIEYFAQFLLLLAAAILARLDLQQAGYSKGKASVVLIFLCLAGFASGLAFFLVAQSS